MISHSSVFIHLYSRFISFPILAVWFISKWVTEEYGQVWTSFDFCQLDKSFNLVFSFFFSQILMLLSNTINIMKMSDLDKLSGSVSGKKKVLNRWFSFYLHFLFFFLILTLCLCLSMPLSLPLFLSHTYVTYTYTILLYRYTDKLNDFNIFMTSSKAVPHKAFFCYS